jgi:hypothetical protein
MLRMFEGKISSQSCEAAEGQKIYRIIGDYSHSNIIYALTDLNDLIVYEAKQSGGAQKGENIDCKSKISSITL